MNITVLGAGSWGSALAIALAPRHEIVLWGRNKHLIHRASQTRQHQSFNFPPAIAFTSDFGQAIAHLSAAGNRSESLLIVASSISGLRPISQALRAYSIPNLVWLCKGLEENSFLLPHQIVQQELSTSLLCGALSGPSFAQEVALNKPCALTIASYSPALSELVISAFHGPTMRIYSSSDVVGVEVGGAVKNILAIATGIVDGLGLGFNARAALITRGLAEITRLGLALGGRAETFMGLTGVGDLILTCTGDLSRNRQVGLALAQGKPLTQIIAELGHVAEGVRCAQAVQNLSHQYGVEMPITDAVTGVLFRSDSVRDMVQRLLARDATSEIR
ncbi:MAG: NAD(P)-dependent glycerol-3-phosphate dehydrogenase [Solimicrobium sp.]|jgi:glycerol-3-phosphate dehydrogenase (NAD(P)+)|nr:NAD(P)-dependent glycerol-3-phosphate dehydrogenase [Solimicrobium sp.]